MCIQFISLIIFAPLLASKIHRAYPIVTSYNCKFANKYTYLIDLKEFMQSGNKITHYIQTYKATISQIFPIYNIRDHCGFNSQRLSDSHLTRTVHIR
jgi:hypothetical protein